MDLQLLPFDLPLVVFNVWRGRPGLEGTFDLADDPGSTIQLGTRTGEELLDAPSHVLEGCLRKLPEIFRALFLDRCLESFAYVETVVGKLDGCFVRIHLVLIMSWMRSESLQVDSVGEY